MCVNDDEKVIGTFFFTHGEDIEPTYREITDGAWLDDTDATTKLTTQELIDYIKARTVQLSTDPVNSTIEQVS